MTAGTYAEDGSVLPPAYSFTRLTTRATETLLNDGAGAPVRRTGMVRSAFRPSDDATTYPFLVPANMLFARALAGAGAIVSELEAAGDVEVPAGLAKEMADFSAEVRAAITRYGVVTVPVLGGNGTETETVYAYEVDGYGSAALMDDANVPSLLAAPVFGYLGAIDPVYQRTRKRLLSAEGNPYFMTGKVINAIGGPHAGPGMAWPMASVVRILTSEDDEEIEASLRELVASTDGLGLIHESINSNDASKWTRQW
jgi:meiotically up-regulated gene 157 (Mug157) protein